LLSITTTLKTAPVSFTLPDTIMEAKVRAFNNLPRSEKVPSGLVPNHWVFGVCHLDIKAGCDLVLAVNPSGVYFNSAAPALILSLPTTSEKVEGTISCLLDAFASPTLGVDPTEIGPWTAPFLSGHAGRPDEIWGDWTAKLPLYMLAMNTMDQGVPVGGNRKLQLTTLPADSGAGTGSEFCWCLHSKRLGDCNRSKE
jgi:hypothetical protein